MTPQLPPPPPPPPAAEHPKRPSLFRPGRNKLAYCGFLCGLSSPLILPLFCIPIVGWIAVISPLLAIAAAGMGFAASRQVRAGIGIEQDARHARLAMILGGVVLVLAVCFMAAVLALLGWILSLVAWLWEFATGSPA